MNEIEVKAKLKDKQLAVNYIESLGCKLSELIIQKDCIYIEPENHIVGGKPNVLRIREQNGKIIFTLKKDRSNELDCIEQETEVSNRIQLENIIRELGFAEYARVEKIRQKTKYNEYEICLDEVKELGSFIEVEKMSNEDGEIVQSELFEFLKPFGVTEADRVFKGYDTLIHNKLNS